MNWQISETHVSQRFAKMSYNWAWPIHIEPGWISHIGPVLAHLLAYDAKYMNVVDVFGYQCNSLFAFVFLS